MANEFNGDCVFRDDRIGDDDEIYINADDGLPNVHPNIEDLNSDIGLNDDNLDELPKSLIVTNIDNDILMSEKLRDEMEDLFRTISPEVTFQWLRSFKRLRVNFETPTAAANARIQLHQFRFNQSCINCYFAQPVTPVTVKTLQPPAPVKQFLISPPSSPPLGWEPREEGEPLVNHDLLAALASLAPGECHELLAPSETQPGIVVHTALQSDAPKGSLRIPQTRCPDF